jgi:hypothetical protein
VPLTRRRFGALTGATVLAASGPALIDTSAWAAPAKASYGGLQHLLRRTTYGATPELVHQVSKQGAHAWLEDQLHPHRVNDAAMDALLTRWPTLKWQTWQARKHLSFGAWDVMFDLVDAHIARAIWSKRQLLEINRHVFDREVIRKYALGSFSDMLCATGKSPAMLQYLGNAESTAAAPNENWGRELLELHTVGLAADYSQKEVHDSALILTGLSVDETSGLYQYEPGMHYTGHVKVLGFHSANHSASKGESVAMAYLSYLAHHPDTARHLATELAVRFVSDSPSKHLVNSLAATYRRHGTQIVPVLRQLFASKEFAQSSGAKVRTPYEDFIATARVLRIRPPHKGTESIRELQWMAGSVGQPPLGWHAPNGYPDTAAAWSSTSATLGKWNAHMSLAGQWWPKGLHYTKLTSLVPTPQPKTYGRLFDGLAAALNVPALNTTQRSALAHFLDHKPSDPLLSTDAALTWRLSALVALILDSSHQAER